MMSPDYKFKVLRVLAATKIYGRMVLTHRPPDEYPYEEHDCVQCKRNDGLALRSSYDQPYYYRVNGRSYTVCLNCYAGTLDDPDGNPLSPNFDFDPEAYVNILYEQLTHDLTFSLAWSGEWRFE